MSDRLTQIYGRGWAFPPVFMPDGVKMAEGAEDVGQSLWILFNTQPGERIMRDGFGCDLNQFMFAGIKNSLLSDIERQIENSVLRYEPRAQIIDIKFDATTPSEGHLKIQVNYCLRGSDMQQQLTGQLDMVNGQGISP
ncbi:phage baseplate protein [Burkholderia ubonensis]|uniref:GPW/gp25 family protein n=1 Tax=Burkholderia ubonensis TaxID=101571 RepID=UPI00075DAEB8|nr:GPW/gp25 family protein [Burkholderia ubonensis]KVQ00511.1 phage baseplate protein [Burkholderia ubonensis]